MQAFLSFWLNAGAQITYGGQLQKAPSFFKPLGGQNVERKLKIQLKRPKGIDHFIPRDKS